MQSYQEAEQWLFSQLANYQNQGSSAYKPGLENILQWTAHFENPHLAYPSIHVAGTNGKGSTSHMIASVLQSQGYTVGLFTSPHLKHFSERIRINGQPIAEDYILSFIQSIQNHPWVANGSFFEITTVMAFQYFKEKKVDFAIIETGLGGRLDATNILSPLVSVITSISLDHTQILGNTIEAIAFEKAGIIKENTPVILGKLPIRAEKVIGELASTKNAKVFHSQNITNSYPMDVQGQYQWENQKTALQTIYVLQDLGIEISEKALQNGFQNIVSNTHLRGRWEIVQQNPMVILDTAHNIAGIQYAIEQLAKWGWENVMFIIGFVKDKEVEEILKILPTSARYVFVKPSIFRGLSPFEYEKSIPTELRYTIEEDVTKAYFQSVQNALSNEVIWVGGSNFVIADLI